MMYYLVEAVAKEERLLFSTTRPRTRCSAIRVHRQRNLRRHPWLLPQRYCWPAAFPMAPEK